MATNEVLKFEGKSIVTYFRPLKNASKEAATLLPGQTSAEFDPQRDSDSTSTKDGSFQTSSSLETDLEVDFVNNTSAIADQFYDSLLNNEVMEIWLVNTARKNADGKFFAWYCAELSQKTTIAMIQMTFPNVMLAFLLMVRHNVGG